MRSVTGVTGWWYDRPILVKGLVVIAIPVLPLLLLSFLYFPADRRAERFDEGLRNALDLTGRTQGLIISIQEVRSGSRGYAITGEPSYLDHYERSRSAVPSALAGLRTALNAHEGGEALGEAIAVLVDRKLENLRRTMEAYAAAPVGAGIGAPGTEGLVRDGEEIMAALEATVEPLRTQADSVQRAFAAEGGNLHLVPRRLIAVAGMVGILGGIGASLLFSSSVGRRIRRLGLNTQRLLDGEGPLIPAIDSDDEIGRLARSLEEARGVLLERQEALRRSDERFALAVRGSRDGLWDWDLETGALYFSPRWKEILGFEDHELRNEYSEFEDRVHPEDLPAVRAAIEGHLEGGSESYRIEMRMQHRDGSWRWILSKGGCIRNAEGRAVRFSGAHADITERRLREEELRQARGDAEAATRAKSAFLAAMSHELRTPLNAVIGFSELLQDRMAGELTEKQARYVDNVLSSGRHLLELINDILDLSKVEAGRMALHVEPIAPGRVLQNSVQVVQGLAYEKKLRLSLDFPGDLPLLQADEGRLKQVLYNLLSNAVKFTEAGGEIELGARIEVESGKEWLRIWVRDTGIGIPLQDIERIFGEFEQIDSSYARRQQGTGLGLPLTRKLVGLHGGRVTVSSQVGKGSTFTVMLPLEGPEGRQGEGSEEATIEWGEAIAESGALPARRTPDAPGGGPEDAPLVLVIEDDPWAQDLLLRYLEDAGFRTLLAANGNEGVALARKWRPDLITLDILLPGRDGWEILEELKRDARLQEIPVVVVTVTEDRSLGFTLGAAGFFQKPVTRDVLLASIRSLLPARRNGSLRILAVDDDETSLAMIEGILHEVGHEVMTASGGREGIELARSDRPDLIILDLIMPEVTGFDVAAALGASPETADIPILVWTGKELTAEDHARLRDRVRHVTRKSTREDFLNALDRLVGSSPAPGGTSGR